MTRRAFVASAGSALAYSQTSGANERIRIGIIGCGGQAAGHLRGLLQSKEADNIEIVAVSDVFTKRAEKFKEMAAGAPKVYQDYRNLLSDKSVDYVLIATPEHWHYQMILDAANAGKHIYCEKPMTQHIEEARKVVQKIHGSKIKMQVGVQGMSDESYATANRYIKEGALGKVVLAQIDYSRNHKDDFFNYDLDPDARPGENLDWNMWLGSRPKRAFDPDRYQNWRRYWEYSSGIASDLFVHRATRMIKSLDLKVPEYVVATGGKFVFPESKAEIPDTMSVLLDYPGGLTLQLVSSMANDYKIPHVIRGHKGTLEFTSTGFTITPQKLFEAEAKEVVYERTGAESLTLHHRNLFNAIRKDEPLKCDVNLGYYGVVACEMATLSYRRRKYMKWDAAKDRPTAI
jgi:predicted dehydrogenase